MSTPTDEQPFDAEEWRPVTARSVRRRLLAAAGANPEDFDRASSRSGSSQPSTPPSPPGSPAGLPLSGASPAASSPQHPPASPGARDAGWSLSPSRAARPMTQLTDPQERFTVAGHHRVVCQRLLASKPLRRRYPTLPPPQAGLETSVGSVQPARSATPAAAAEFLHGSFTPVRTPARGRRVSLPRRPSTVPALRPVLDGGDAPTAEGPSADAQGVEAEAGDTSEPSVAAGADGHFDDTAEEAEVEPQGRAVVSSTDLSALARLAAVQSDCRLAKQQPQLRSHLPMTHLNLRWIFDAGMRPHRHPSEADDAAQRRQPQPQQPAMLPEGGGELPEGPGRPGSAPRSAAGRRVSMLEAPGVEGPATASPGRVWRTLETMRTDLLTKAAPHCTRRAEQQLDLSIGPGDMPGRPTSPGGRSATPGKPPPARAPETPGAQARRSKKHRGRADATPPPEGRDPYGSRPPTRDVATPLRPSGTLRPGTRGVESVAPDTDVAAVAERPHTEVLLDSPRSVLTLLSRGVDPLDLQVADPQAARRKIRLTGAGEPAVEARLVFLEAERARLLESCRAEYRRICRVLPLHEVMAFFDMFLSYGCDYANVPALSFDPDLGIYTAAVQDNDREAARLRALQEKTAEDRRRLRRVLAKEVAARERQRDAAAAQQRHRAAAALRHTAAAKKRKVELAEEWELRGVMAAARAERREQLLLATTTAEEAAFRQREARAARASKVATEAVAQRRQIRTARMAAATEARAVRVEAAQRRAEELEAEQRARLAAKGEYRKVVEQEAAEAAAVRAEDRRRRRAAQQQRREEVVSRADHTRAERQAKAVQRQADVAQSMAEFRAAQAVEREVRHMRELKKELVLEQLRDAREEREAEAEAVANRKREAQDVRYNARRETLRTKSEAVAERQLESRLARVAVVDRSDRKDEFARVAAMDAADAKGRAAERMEQARAAFVTKATAQRMALKFERQGQLRANTAQGEEDERELFFEIFGRTDPRPSTLLKPVPAPEYTRRAVTPLPDSTVEPPSLRAYALTPL